MERLFVDTSAWFAYVNRSDPEHRSIQGVLTGFTGRLVTSNFILDETVTLVRYRLGHAVAVEAGETLLDPQSVDLIRLTAADEREGWKIFVARSDQHYSYTDCTSFVLMRRLGITKVAALDDDFRQEGYHVLP